MKWILCLYDESEAVELFFVFCAGRNQVNPCGFDAGVAEHVGQARHIMADAVERDCKQ